MDENINVASGVIVLREDNKFAPTADDGNIYAFSIVLGVDTSIPITFENQFYPEGAGSGDIVYYCDIYKVKEGDLLNGTAVASATLRNTIPVDNQQDELIKTKFKFFIDDLLPGDLVVLDAGRIGTDAADTFASSIVDISGRAISHFWRP